MWRFGAIVGLILIASTNARGLTIEFDSPPVEAGGSFRTSEYTEEGFRFQPASPSVQFSRTGPQASGNLPQDGSSYIQLLVTERLEFFAVDGSPFHLVSMDLAEYSSVAVNPTTVEINAQTSSGDLLTVYLQLDGVIDGAGPLPDFETFLMGSEFDSVAWVKINSWPLSIDNVTVQVIPEPTTFILLASGLALLGFHRCRSSCAA